MRLALRDQPATPFRVPRAIELIPIDAKTGQRAIFGEEGVILEAFKPGEEPAGSTTIIGEDLASVTTESIYGAGQQLVPPADSEQSVEEGGLTTGTGGLY